MQDIYQSMLESVSLVHHIGDDGAASGSLHLTFQTEAGLQEFVRTLRQLWEARTGAKLEVLFYY